MAESLFLQKCSQMSMKRKNKRYGLAYTQQAKKNRLNNSSFKKSPN